MCEQKLLPNEAIKHLWLVSVPTFYPRKGIKDLLSFVIYHELECPENTCLYFESFVRIQSNKSKFKHDNNIRFDVLNDSLSLFDP